MSVVFVTTRGAFVIDLYLKYTPMCGFNFLKLCKLGYYTNSIFYEIVENFIMKIGHINDYGGQSIYGLLSNDPNLKFPDEITPVLTHAKAGIVSTCNTAKDSNASDFFITLGYDCSRFDDKHTIFGEISENFELLQKISQEYTDKEGRPYRNIRILETRILYDPFDDPPGFEKLMKTFVPKERIRDIDHLEDDEVIHEISAEQHREEMEQIKARQNAQILEMLGDIPDIDAKPPDTALFICKLNPRTNEDGLTIVFSRFGHVERVDLIRDKKTNESLCYAFVDFSKPSEAENAYIHMQRALIDGRQVLVDFCQSVRGPKKV
ncbi:hypothetical protein TRFO_39593 [Tritrichomonas foetus]|uniref:Peptidyl-prolyl cis-trans isomerase n=1 Tax=Tritrichomonas foetus TaxID=1144522 RepID=A0A1J4J9R1_9EUKA|nr:hypothetical protein TRFO_39593 [Tritrichomonas foetus]|eukprot:OHS94173.1 hypothetical protein TRFO_39593 [Tritrichomonas foetus]